MLASACFCLLWVALAALAACDFRSIATQVLPGSFFALVAHFFDFLAHFFDFCWIFGGFGRGLGGFWADFGLVFAVFLHLYRK